MAHAGGFGYQQDSDSGLMLLGHRYYDPSTGRFLTRDPIKDGRNWHTYGGGDGAPTGFVDPDGLVVWKIWIIWHGGRKIVYIIHKTRAGAKAGAGAIRNRPGGKPGVTKPEHHHGGPKHYHDRNRNGRGHHTWESEAQAAKKRGADGWEGYR
jgi:RHS repeat-associated protein